MTRYIPRSAIIEAQSFQPGMEDGWAVVSKLTNNPQSVFDTEDEAKRSAEKYAYLEPEVRPAVINNSEGAKYFDMDKVSAGQFGYHVVTNADGTRSLIDPSTFSRDYIHFIG